MSEGRHGTEREEDTGKEQTKAQKARHGDAVEISERSSRERERETKEAKPSARPLLPRVGEQQQQQKEINQSKSRDFSTQP